MSCDDEAIRRGDVEVFTDVFGRLEVVTFGSWSFTRASSRLSEWTPISKLDARYRLGGSD
jgi:hypothetical protein